VLQCTSVLYSGNGLKKNVSEITPGDIPFDFGKGIYFYEEFHHHLVQCNRKSQAYSMGMEIIYRYGLKYFLNKFKRKETVYPTRCIFPAPVPPKADAIQHDAGCSRELIFVLAEMIQSAGSYYGV
jgi:hypothetical protein